MQVQSHDEVAAWMAVQPVGAPLLYETVPAYPAAQVHCPTRPKYPVGH